MVQRSLKKIIKRPMIDVLKIFKKFKKKSTIDGRKSLSLKKLFKKFAFLGLKFQEMFCLKNLR